MSAKLDIFNDITTKLEAILDSNDKRIIQTIGIWNNQFDNEAEEDAFNYPAVFIEFAEIPWTSTNQPPSSLGSQGNVSKEQKGVGALITLHAGFSHLEDETTSFPIIDATLELIYFAIQGLTGTYYQPLLRSAELQDTDHNRVIDWQQGFTTTMLQGGTPDENLTEIAAGTLDVETNVDLDIDNDVIRTGDGTV